MTILLSIMVSLLRNPIVYSPNDQSMCQESVVGLALEMPLDEIKKVLILTRVNFRNVTSYTNQN